MHRARRTQWHMTSQRDIHTTLPLLPRRWAHVVMLEPSTSNTTALKILSNNRVHTNVVGISFIEVHRESERERGKREMERETFSCFINYSPTGNRHCKQCLRRDSCLPVNFRYREDIYHTVDLAEAWSSAIAMEIHRENAVTSYSVYFKKIQSEHELRTSVECNPMPFDSVHHCSHFSLVVKCILTWRKFKYFKRKVEV